MNLSNIYSIQHESTIFSIALSRDNRLLACGGANRPVTVWNLAEGVLVSRLEGLPHQTHSLAFSPDSQRLAAINLWGGFCVWRLADGTLLHNNPDSSVRKIRSIVYPATARSAIKPVVISESIYSQRQRLLAADGVKLAVKNGAMDVQLQRYRSNVEVARLDLNKYPITGSGARSMAWSSDSTTLALAGKGWAGAWKFSGNEPTFHCTTLPADPIIEQMAILSDSLQLIFARNRTLDVVTLPQEPLLTAWQAYLAQIPETLPDFVARRDWQWGSTQWGHEGVHTFEGKLLWYSHSHNPHAGGGALAQSFADFLAAGPSVSGTASPPEEILKQVCQAARLLNNAIGASS